MGLGSRHHALDVHVARDVTCVSLGLSAGAHDQPDGLLEVGLVDVGAEHPPTSRTKGERHRPPDSLSATGDNHDFCL